MDCKLWTTILLDWVNQTEFLQKYYENIEDTAIKEFFEQFKANIKSVSIEAENVFLFIKAKYAGFAFTTNDDAAISTDDYVHIYSMLLHYSCVRQPDQKMQSICNNMAETYQTLIAKFFNSLLKVENYTRASIQDAIEHAESAAPLMFDTSPLNRSAIPTVSPRTPRTKMLDNFNLDNRKLRAQLESERTDKAYQEMELNHQRELFNALEKKYKESQTQIHQLKRDIQALEDQQSPQKQSKDNQMVRRLGKQLKEKDVELAELELSKNALDDRMALFEKQISFFSGQVRTLRDENEELSDRLTNMQTELEEASKLNEHISNNNKELEEINKGLRSQLDKSGFDSSFDMLNGLPSANSSFVVPENMANAVVDVRLGDQQKQNQELLSQLESIRAECQMLFEEYRSVLTDVLEMDSAKKLNVCQVSSEFKKVVSALSAKTEEVHVMQSTIDTCKQHETELRECKEALLKEIVAFQQTDKTQKKQIDSLSSEAQRLSDELQASYAKTQELDEVLAVRKDEIETLTQEKDKLLVDMEEKVNEQIRSKSEIEAKLKSEIESGQQKCSDLQRKLEQTIASNLDEVQSLQREREQLLTVMEDKVAEQIRIKSEIEAKLTSEIDSAKQSCSDLEQKLVDITEANQKDVETLKQDQQRLLAGLEEKLSEEVCSKTEIQTILTSKLESVTQKCSELEHELKKAIAANQDVVKSLKREKEQLLADMEDKTIEQIRSRSEIEAKLTSEIDSSQKKCSDLERELENALATNQDKIESLKKEKDLLLADMEVKLNEQIQSKSEIEATLTSEIETAKQKYLELEHEFMKTLVAKDTEMETMKEEKNRLLAEMTEQVSEQNRSKSEIEAKLTSEIEDVQKKCSDLELELVTNQNQIALLEKEKNQLSSEIEEKVNEIRSKSEIEAKLTDEIESAKQSCIDLEQKLVEITEANQKDIETLKLDQQRLLSDLEEKLSEEVCLKTEIQSTLTNKLESATQKCSQLERELEQTLTAHQNEVESIRSEKEQLLTDMENEASEQIRNKSDIEAKLTSELEKAQQKCAELERELEMTLAANKDQAESFKYERNQLLADKSEIETKLSSEIEAVQQKCLNLTSEIESNQKKCSDLEREIEIARAANQKQIESSKKEKDLLLADMEEKITEQIRSKSEIEVKLTGEIEKAQQKCSELEMTLAGNKDQAEYLKKEQNQLLADKSEIESKLTSEIEAAQQKCLSLTSEIESSQKKCSELEREIENALATSQNQMESLKKEKDLLLVDMEEKVNEQIRSRTEVEARLTNEIEAVQQKCSKLESDHQLMVDEKVGFEKKIQEQASQIKLINGNLVSIAETLKLVRRDKSALESKLEDMSKETVGTSNIMFNLQTEKADLEVEVEKLKHEIKAQLEKMTIQENIIKTARADASAQKEELETSISVLKLKLETVETQNANEKPSRSESDENLIESLKAEIKQITERREKDVQVFGAKLTKTREQLDKTKEALDNEKRQKEELMTQNKNADELIRENRQQNEVKLEKMKDKMKTLYNEEMAKVKVKHEKESSELKLQSEKSRNYIERLSQEIYTLNEKQLELQKDNEFMKNRIRHLENNSFSGRPSLPINAKLMGKIPGGNFKMEDEEGELFNNTYLEELKTGRFSPTHESAPRDSITRDELTRRNSMYPWHLRSSYAPQYADQNLNEDDVLKPKAETRAMDDSMISVQSDGRRGTIYKRPGPPTPSKNGGRLSVGGELPRGEILREHNQIDGGKTSQSAKKGTPGGKRRSILHYSTSKFTEV